MSLPKRPCRFRLSKLLKVIGARSLTHTRFAPLFSAAIVSLALVPRTTRSSVATAPVRVIASIPTKLVLLAVSGVLIVPASFVAPGVTVVVPPWYW